MVDVVPPEPDDARWLGLGAEAGLCRSCRYPALTETRRGTVYLRCRRAASDDRLRKHPPLPVLRCPGYEGPA